MTRTFLFLAVLGVATAGIARAQSFDVIETRQAGQDLLAGDFAGIRGVVAAKGDIKTLEVPSKAMARWARQIPTLFPKGSETGHNTKATAAVSQCISQSRQRAATSACSASPSTRSRQGRSSSSSRAP